MVRALQPAAPTDCRSDAAAEHESLLVCLLFAGTGALLWNGVIHGSGAVIVFVVSGSIVALCLHEFGHAIVARNGGDWTVAQTGYLDLDPLKYPDPLLSIVLPLVYVLIGGFALPGGAVWINSGSSSVMIRTSRFVSAAIFNACRPSCRGDLAHSQSPDAALYRLSEFRTRRKCFRSRDQHGSRGDHPV